MRIILIFSVLQIHKKAVKMFFMKKITYIVLNIIYSDNQKTLE